MQRIGVIGLGMMGRMHLGVYEKLADATVVAIADADPKRAGGDLSGGWSNIKTDASNQLPMDRLRGTTDPRELIGWDEVDIVDICVPTPDHTALAIAALEAGKHVLCEKHLALSAAEAQRIAAAAAKARGFFMPAMCIRFWPQYAWLKQAVDQKRYGALRSLVMRRGGPIPGGWFQNGEMSGGAIWDLHIHDADFVCYLLGMPRSVRSQGYTGPTGRIDHVLTQYDYGDVPLVAAEGCWTVHPPHPFNMTYDAVFEKATARFDFAADPKLTVYADGKAEGIDCGEAMGYDEELAYFVSCCERGEGPSVVTAADAVASLKVVEAEARSAADGAVVAL
jgi:predicted dehydrogenase